MLKVKVKKEYFIDLLDKQKGSVRDERKEKGFTLLDTRPDWATEDNLWAKTELNYKRKIEGWEKLCIEAYLCGWIDYFDMVWKVPNEARTIYFEWEEDKKDKLASLKVYLYSDPKQPAPDPPTFQSGTAPVPKPPPPPLS
jgi:hypothetical protein